MSGNNFLDLDDKRLCQFYDNCTTSKFVRNMFRNGESSKLLKIEKEDYNEHCIRGGFCEPLYGDLIKLKQGIFSRIKHSKMSVDHEARVEEVLFNAAEEYSEIEKMKGNEIYELVEDRE